jgi:hypothetical protein
MIVSMSSSLAWSGGAPIRPGAPPLVRASGAGLSPIGREPQPEPDRLAGLPEDERETCHAHWVRVDAMLARSGQGTSP